MKLYYCPMTRATRPRWLLEELEVPYELERVDLPSGAHKAPSYLAVHPHGAVPALDDGGTVIIESGAICAYLADRYLELGLAPRLEDPARGPYLQWLFYAAATVEPPLVDVFLHTVRLPEERRDPARADEGRARFDEIARVLTTSLEGRCFLVGGRFGTADVMVGSMIAWAGFLGLLEPWPVLQDYLDRLSARPAYLRAHAD